MLALAVNTNTQAECHAQNHSMGTMRDLDFGASISGFWIKLQCFWPGLQNTNANSLTPHLKSLNCHHSSGACTPPRTTAMTDFAELVSFSLSPNSWTCFLLSNPFDAFVSPPYQAEQEVYIDHRFVPTTSAFHTQSLSTLLSMAPQIWCPL